MGTGAAGHPALREICEHILSHAVTAFSNDVDRDTLERTGPGAFTDAVLRHSGPAAPAETLRNWPIRILPRVAFGIIYMHDDFPYAAFTPGVLVQHHFKGATKSAGQASFYFSMFVRSQ